MMLLHVHNVTTGYERAQVLRDISVTVNEREIVALIGPNGAGKTTFLQTVVGILKPWEGNVSFKGQKIDRLRPHEIVALGVSYSPEGRDIFANLTVFENLQIGGYLINDHKAFNSNLERIYELFPRLFERKKQIAGSLSGGEQQMLAIGRALMSEPVLLLLDEPSLGLAPIVVESIFETITKINKDGTSILLVEQNVGLALDVAARAYVMEKGEIRLADTADVLRESAYIKDSYLGIA